MRYFIISVLLVFLISCGNKETPTLSDSDLRIIENHKTDSINENKSKELIDKYNAVYKWDSARLYSFELDNLFKDKIKLFAVKSGIADISTKDSCYILKIHGRNCIIELELTERQLSQILTLSVPHKRNKGMFIFTGIKSKTTYPKLSSETEGEGDNVSSYIMYDFDVALMTIRGKLIDSYIFKK